MKTNIVAGLFTIGACVQTFATPVVLDEYSNLQNFIDGKYTLYEIYNGSGGDPFFAEPNISLNLSGNGVLSIKTGWRQTAAYMWNAGETIEQVGDKVSIEVVQVPSGSAGLALDADLEDPEGYAELRHFFFPNSVENYFNGPWGIAPLDGNATGTMLLEVEFLSRTDATMHLSATLSGPGFSSITEQFDMDAAQLYFGPVTWRNSHGGTQLDNLIYEAAPVLQGDMNGDGLLTNGDISAFVLALTNPQAFDALFPYVSPDRFGDFDGDNQFTNGDISGFVDVLTGGGASASSIQAQFDLAYTAAVPEPASAGLLFALGAGVLARRRR